MSSRTYTTCSYNFNIIATIVCPRAHETHLKHHHRPSRSTRSHDHTVSNLLAKTLKVHDKTASPQIPNFARKGEEEEVRKSVTGIHNVVWTGRYPLAYNQPTSRNLSGASRRMNCRCNALSRSVQIALQNRANYYVTFRQPRDVIPSRY